MTCHRCSLPATVAIQRVTHGYVETLCEPCAGPRAPTVAADVIRRGTVCGERATLRDVGEIVLFGGAHGEIQSMAVTPASRGAVVATLGTWFDGDSP